MTRHATRLSIVVALVFVVLYAGYRGFVAALVVLDSEPSNALVRVDGKAAGRTPLKLVLVPGSYRLQVRHELYIHSNESITLAFGETLKKTVVLEPGVGTLTLLSNPRGAWVEVDGRRLAAATPTSVTLATGEHRVEMGLAERHGFSELVALKVGQTKQVIAELNIDPHGSVNISTKPVGGRITFLETDIVYSPGVRIPIGSYRIRIAMVGYVSQDINYRVRYGENHHHVVLEREFGVLALRVDPSDAQVSVTYPDVDGKTMLRMPQAPQMRIPVGPVNVRVRAMGKRSVVRNITLTRAGKTMRIGLEKMNVQIGRQFRDALQDGGQGPLVIIVPPGKFVMGDADGARSERPARTVVLTEPFAVTVNEITMAEYLAFARATGKSLHDRMDLGRLDYPVRRVYWSDAELYSQWLSQQTGESYKLPTETQWEYIARAGSQSDYYFGDDVDELCRHANFADKSTGQKFRLWDVADCDDGFETLAPVGSFAPNPFGLYDIYGTVSEWVLDCDMKSYRGANEPTGARVSKPSSQSATSHNLNF